MQMNIVNWQLAQLNIARRRYELDDPKMKGFVDGLDPVNALAEQTKGFVWRLQTEEGDATGITIYDDPTIIVNMSVWESLDTLMMFVRSESHMSIMKQRRDWFERPDQPYLVLWWVPENHRPTVEEAEDRLDQLRRQGPSSQAFSVRDTYAAPDPTTV
jgi:hypothetical protein